MTLAANRKAVALKGQIVLYRYQDQNQESSKYLERIEGAPGKVAVIPWDQNYWFLAVGKPQLLEVGS